WIAVVLLGAAIVVVVLRARGPVVRTTSAVRKDLEQHVIASGRVWVPARVQVSAQVPGLVVAVGAVVGQRVQAGSLLVQIDDAEAQAAVEQAKAAVEQASAKVEQLRRVGSIVANEGLRQAESNLERALSDLDRTSQLAASGAATLSALDDARRAVDIARAQRNAAEAQQIAAAPMGADSRIALTALRQAEAQLAGANVRLGQTRLVALQDATILERAVEVGDVVQPGRTLLVMAAEGAAEIVFQPDERNLAHMRLGQTARVSPDAFPQQVFDAELHYIAPSIDPERGSVEVRLRVPEAPPSLRPDMTVSVDLTVATRPQALTLTPDALRGATTPAPWVFVVEAGRVVRREVALGIRGDGAVEITSGLDESDEVVLADGRQLAAGQRVRIDHEVP
ncbi:MAG: efflux RND transporter periplasmic adaptor subunit, partial [Polyangiaceae bacterium]|nr:efflux RND transporter periplasmic adaptor subunit [Polyangiaceae bacterium]